MWRSRSGRGRGPNKCSRCGLPTKNHDGPYGPRCPNRRLNSSASAMQYESYMDSTEKDKQRDSDKQRDEMQDEQRKEDEAHNSQEGQQNQEEDIVQEEDEPELEVIEEDEQEQLKDVLKGLATQMKELKVQVGEIAKKQEGIDRSRQVNNETNNNGDDSNLNWRGHKPVHECLTMPQLMRENHSSPAVGAVGGGYLRPAPSCNLLPRDRPYRVPGLRPVLDREDLSRYCPVPGIPEKVLKGALSGEYFLIESFLQNSVIEPDDSKPMEL